MPVRRFASLGLTLLLSLCLGSGLSGCSRRAVPPEGFGVNLTIDAQPMSARAQVRRLTISSSGAETYSRTVDVAEVVARRGYVQIRYVPGVDRGDLSFVIDALDEAGGVRGHGGDGPVTLVPGQAVNLTIALSDVVVEGPDFGTPDLYTAQCTNAALDPGETDIDCGGPCPGCEPGRSCMQPTDCATATCTNGHCELASGPPSWVPLTALPTGRSYTAAAGLNDQKIYAVGGIIGTDPTATVQYFNLPTNDWTSISALPAARAAAPAVVANDKIYIPGGVFSPTVGTFDSYSDVLSSTATPPVFSTFGALGIKRAYHGTALAGDGRVYVVGGMAAPTTTPLASVQSFPPADPFAGLVDAPVLPVARAELGLAADTAGRLVAVGGRLSDDTVTARVDLFDAGAQTWSDGPTLITPRKRVAAVQGGDGRVYAVGGADGAGMALGNVEALSGGTRWVSLPAITPARFGVALARGWDGRIYAIGGDAGSGPRPEVEAYGPRLVPGPATGNVGDVIALSCSNFAANAKVTVTFSGDAQGTIAASGMTNSSGDVAPSLVWQVPQVASGTYILTAVDDHARYTVRASFVVP